MAKYKKVGNKLAVKGINSQLGIIAVIFSSVILVFYCAYSYINLHDRELAVGLQLLLALTFFAMLAFQLLTITSYFKHKKIVHVFDKYNGTVECYFGKKYRRHEVGENQYWRAQETSYVTRKRKEGRVYHAVLVGTQGESYIGVASISVRGLKKRLEKINKYIDGKIITSKDVLTSEKVLNKLINKD